MCVFFPACGPVADAVVPLCRCHCCCLLVISYFTHFPVALVKQTVSIETTGMEFYFVVTLNFYDGLDLQAAFMFEFRQI